MLCSFPRPLTVWLMSMIGWTSIRLASKAFVKTSLLMRVPLLTFFEHQWLNFIDCAN
jgi:hypothetical protein